MGDNEDKDKDGKHAGAPKGWKQHVPDPNDITTDGEGKGGGSREKGGKGK